MDLKKSTIVIISENYDLIEDFDINSHECEYTSKRTLEQFLDSLSNIFGEVIYYESPKVFSNNIMKHRDHIIFSPWLGSKSRNRKGFIPSICEANNIKYLGADAYIQLICNDKYLSKKLALDFNILSPNSILYDENRILPSLEFLSTLNYPVVVKPALEGGSIGISDNSIVYNCADALLLASQLYSNFNQPILIEEYIEGPEVSICIIGGGNKIHFWGASTFLFDNSTKPNGRIWGFESKKNRVPNFSVNTQKCDLIDKKMHENLINLFHSLGKVDYMRIDGRIKNGEFHLIEFSPDVHLGVEGTFFTTYNRETAGSHKSMLELITKSSLSNQ